MLQVKPSLHTQHRFPLFSLIFLLTGLSTGILTILPYSPMNSALSSFEISQTTRTFLENWLTSTLMPAMRFVSLGLILMSAVLFLTRHQGEKLIEKLINRMASAEKSFAQDTHSIWGMPRRSLFIWFLVCCAFVLLRYWPTLIHGFFRNDEFILLSFNRTEQLSKLILLPHLEHVLPLFRLELAAMVAFFGVSPLPYNIALLLIFALLLFFTFLLMKEMKVIQLGILIALMLFTNLVVACGGIAAGHYALSTFPQLMLFCLMSIWTYMRWQKTSVPILRECKYF